MRWTLLCLVLLLSGCQPLTQQPLSPLAFNSPLYRLADDPGLVYKPTFKQVYMPIVATTGPCGMNAEETQLAALFLADANQQRKNPQCDVHLVNAAQYRARDMAEKGYFSHKDLDGYYANQWAIRFGCRLPTGYPSNENNIESIGLNYPTPSDAWAGWLNSSAHRTHVLGTISFFAAQRLYGFGVVTSSYGKVYVILTTPSC
jgi:uncharacterized protein YkwD